MSELTVGDQVGYYPEAGGRREGKVEGRAPVKGVIAVRLTGDPFAVCLPVKRLRKEDSKNPQPGQQHTKGSIVAKKKSKPSNGDKSGKKARKAAVASDLANPYREGSSMHFIYEALCEGGVVKDIAKKLVKNFPINVRAADVEDEDVHMMREASYRTLDVLKAAEKAGVPTTKDGKGQEAYVKIGN